MKKELALQKMCLIYLTIVLAVCGIILCRQEIKIYNQEKRIEKLEKHCDYLQIREMELASLIGASKNIEKEE